jgi:hypothetical protein
VTTRLPNSDRAVDIMVAAKKSWPIPRLLYTEHPQIRWSKKYQFSVFCMIPSENGLVFGEFWHELEKMLKNSPRLRGAVYRYYN